LSAAKGSFAPAELCAAVSEHVRLHGTDPVALVGLAPDALRQAIHSLQHWFPSELASGAVTPSQVGMAIILDNPLYARCLKAISIGSVFFGANTYIGNGPNFMVKAIAERQKAHAPDFLGYILKYALPILLPVWLTVWLLFFR